MADNSEEKSSTFSPQGKKEKRCAPAEDGDTVLHKKQKPSDSAENASEDKKGPSEVFCENKRASVKRTQDDVEDDFALSPKKIKLEASTEAQDVVLGKDSLARQESKKPYHRRMKHTLNCVLEQMEFYFSDSSLSKDRYLKSMVNRSPDGYVDLSVFANFNKLQSLRHKEGISQNVLIQALSLSKLLQLNDDKTRVKRITPFQEISQEETDRRTVYVEHLPSRATHKWVEQVFSQCGKVAYISLPRYKSSGQSKGFAFVEFATPEEAERACAMLNDPLPDKAMERPGKFPKTNKTLDRLQKFVPLDSVQDNSDSAQEKQEETKAAADSETKRKRKKKSKKKKPQENVAEEASAQADTDPKEQKPEGKKKKKKKKRKPSQPQEQAVEAESLGSAQSEVTTEIQMEKGLETKQTTEASAIDEDKRADAQTKIKAEDSGEDPGMSAEKSEKKTEIASSAQSKKRNKKKKKNKGDTAAASDKVEKQQGVDEKSKNLCKDEASANEKDTTGTGPTQEPKKKLSHKERKLLRQEDIRRKKKQKLKDEENERKENLSNTEGNHTISQPSEDSSKEPEGSQPTSILKLKKAAEKKRVEFDPVPITTEFVEAKGARKRKKTKKEKPHLRVISKKDWISLKEEYIDQQKSHMKALKESLRELRQQENEEAGRPRTQQVKPMDLEDVFGTKPLRLSHEEKMAHVEKMKFTPNVIVQWWCSHEMHRDKIRTMFKESHASSIAYIDANEEARSGYIRFKDETSAEEFAKMSRNSTSFMARVLPADQQEEYWEKANRDRMQKLGRKKREQGCDRIARKMFQRNKATFFNKPSRIVFEEAEDDNENDGNKSVKDEAENDNENDAKDSEKIALDENTT